MRTWTLRKKIKLRGIEIPAGATLTELQVSEAQIRFLQHVGAIAGTTKVTTIDLAPAKQPRKWPSGCCGR